MNKNYLTLSLNNNSYISSALKGHSIHGVNLMERVSSFIGNVTQWVTSPSKGLIYILLIGAIIIITIFIYKNTILEKFSKNTNTEMIVSRYNEKLEWLLEEPFNTYPVIIYNKGQNDDFTKTDMIKKVIPLENVGRESHSYLYHIINNYDNLSDNTIFLPGSIHLDDKKTKAINVLKNVSEKNIDIFHCDKVDDYESQKDFSIDDYLSTSDDNKKLNTDSKIQISDVRPFGKWYQKFFNDKKLDCLPYNAIFSISKATVLNRPKSFYEDLINEVNKHHNPETGHYMERSWAAIFSSDNDKKMYV